MNFEKLNSWGNELHNTVIGHWSLVITHWSLVTGHRSLGIGYSFSSIGNWLL